LVINANEPLRDFARTVRGRLAEHGEVILTVRPGDRRGMLRIRRLAAELGSRGDIETALDGRDQGSGYPYLIVWWAGEAPAMHWRPDDPRPPSRLST
jgi:hypothetical protein